MDAVKNSISGLQPSEEAEDCQRARVESGHQ